MTKDEAISAMNAGYTVQDILNPNYKYRIVDAGTPSAQPMFSAGGVFWVYLPTDRMPDIQYEFANLPTPKPLTVGSSSLPHLVPIGTTYIPSNPTSTPKTPQCSHVWKMYTGLMESFEYCEKCDIKKKDWLDQPVDTKDFEQELLEACRNVVNGINSVPLDLINFFGDPDDTKN